MLDEKSSNTASVVVLCTAPDEATAQDLAAKVLAEKLAAFFSSAVSFFPSRSLMRCCRARSCLCASVILSVAMPADCLAAAICPSTCACC